MPADLPAPCVECAPRGGAWEQTDRGMRRCGCPRGRALAAIDAEAKEKSRDAAKRKTARLEAKRQSRRPAGRCRQAGGGRSNMNASYKDIRERIQEEPTWWDENGTPRYGAFHPDLSPNIYAREVVLLVIACQSCQSRFSVEVNSGFGFGHSLSEQVQKHSIGYGDPPAHSCTGDTMSSDEVAVAEFWARPGMEDWKRVAELEGLIDQ